MNHSFNIRKNSFVIRLLSVAVCACGQRAPAHDPLQAQLLPTDIAVDTLAEPDDAADTDSAPAEAAAVEMKGSCRRLLLDEGTHRRWLIDAVAAARSGAAQDQRKKLDEFLVEIASLESANTNEPLEKVVRQEREYGGNASMGLRLLLPVLTLPLEDVTIWTSGIVSDRPTQGARGCWALVRTGVREILFADTAEDNRPIVRYQYAVAFAADDAEVSTIPIPTYFNDIDAHNMLTVQDLDGDGWEEAVYIASAGWAGQAHDSEGGGTTFMLTAKNGVLRDRPPFERESRYASLSWSLRDVNEDGRLDMELFDGFGTSHPCPSRSDFSNDVGSLFIMVLIQNEQGEFIFENPAGRLKIKSQCGDRNLPLTSVLQVLCERVYGECTGSIRERIREENAPWDCRLDEKGEAQKRKNANEAYQAMLEAAAWTPPFSLAPLCNR